MKTVGIKQLKARLSEYMRAVRQGEVFLVTDRDMVVAELRPPGSSGSSDSGTGTHAGRLSALADTGEISPPAASLDGWGWEPSGLKLSKRAVAQLLEDVRGDR